jgi:hypothetical protein
MGNPSQSQNQRANSGYYYGPTRGLSSPKNSRRACLCLDGRGYSRRCCNGALLEQGIGQTEVAYKAGSFSRAFSNDFDNSLFGN